MATSKETRVRVEVFWKIMAKDLSFNLVLNFSGVLLISKDCSITFSISVDSQSFRVNRCIVITVLLQNKFRFQFKGFWKGLNHTFLFFGESSCVLIQRGKYPSKEKRDAENHVPSHYKCVEGHQDDQYPQQ